VRSRPPSGAAPKVTPRKLQWQFPRWIDPDWFRGSAALTAMMDTFTLVIPDNERYYIRTLRPEVRALSDGPMRRQVLAFFHQEALHGNAHCAYWANLRDQGVDVDRFTRAVHMMLYKVLEPLLPHRIHVANIAAIEHVNAYLAHIFLEGDLLAEADPMLRRLFEWHFAEEIEHKSIAFDVLQRAYPGYFTRAISAVFVFALFHALLLGGTAYVLIRRQRLLRRATVADLCGFWFREGALAASLRFMGRYLKPSFHPWLVDDYHLSIHVLRDINTEACRAAVTKPATDVDE